MLEQSDAVKQAWQATDRTLDIVINVDGTDYQATSINSLSYDAGAFTGDSLGIGSTYENSISVEFSSVIEAFAAGQVVKPQIGIKVNGTFEYTPLGVFIISEVNRDRNNNLTTIKALDQMVKLERDYTSTLTYPAAMLDVVAEIANQGGVTVNQTDLTHLPNLPKLNSAITGQTLRTAIGWIAQFYAGFAAFDRAGQLTIRTTATPDYEINPGEYMQGGLTKNEVTYKTGGIKVSVTTTSTTETGAQEDKTTTLQAGETSGSQIELTNNVMTNDALSTIWTSIKDVSFYPYSLNWFGNPALEAGDWVTLTDTQGNKFNVPVNQLTFTFNGGLESTISANQASQSSTVIPWTGPTQNAITQAITRKMATGNNVYDPSFTEEPKNAKIGDVWFKQNGNNVELWTYSRDSSGNASWQKQEVDSEVKAQVEKAIDESKKLAIEAQTTADGKNKIYRGNSIEDAPKSGVVVGDLFFSSNDLYRYDGTSWEQVVSDTTGAETHAEVEKATSEVKAYSDSVKAQLEADAAKAQATADSITNYVQNSSGSSYLATLLNQSPSNASLSALVNGQVVSAINVSSSGDTLIAGKKIMLDGDVTIDGTAFASKLKATGITVDQLVAGSIDASKIKVINLDANSITTGSLSAAVIRASGFNNYTVSPSNTWDFDYTKSTYGNWFLIGETTADHVFNGPKDANNNPVTPNMYVTSRGTGNNFTVTVWKGTDPTQYQRIWSYDHWTDWVILPNTQNLISAINISPDSVMIAGKKIMLDGDVTINGTAFATKLKATGITVDQLVAGNIDASKINVINLNANNITAGTISGNNLSINLDNGQVAFTKGSLHSTDGGFNINIDTKSFYLDMGNDTKLWIDSNGFHLQESDTQHLWLNKGGLHNYTTSNSNGVLIQDSTLSVLNNNGEGLVAQNGLLQFSTLPTWLDFGANSTLTAQAYGIIGPDKNLFGSSKNGLFVKGREGVVIGTNSYNGETYLGSLFNANSVFGSGISLSDDMTKAALFFTKAPLILAGGPTWDDSNGMSEKPYISVGSDWYYSHSGSGAYMNQVGNGTYTRGNNIIVSSRNTNIIGYDWINFKSFGRIALDADYVHSYPTYLKTTSAGANVYVAADGALVRSTSAAKYKTDIQPASEFAEYGDKLINLIPKIWLDKAEIKRYKGDPTKNKKPGYYYGLIADELDQAGLNKLVTYGADGQVEGIQYDRLAVALLPIIKKLKEDVKELKERILK